jgi:hypothetical protein
MAMTESGRHVAVGARPSRLILSDLNLPHASSFVLERLEQLEHRHATHGPAHDPRHVGSPPAIAHSTFARVAHVDGDGDGVADEALRCVMMAVSLGELTGGAR